MSVVAWDGKTIAADRQGTSSEMRVTTSKMRVISDDLVLAWTGKWELGILMADWYVAGARKEEYPEFQEGDDWVRFIVARPGGISMYEKMPVALPVYDKFIAFGTGRDFAMGALAEGASAIRAVEVASQFNIYCGQGVEFHTFGQ